MSFKKTFSLAVCHSLRPLNSHLLKRELFALHVLFILVGTRINKFRQQWIKDVLIATIANSKSVFNIHKEKESRKMFAFTVYWLCPTEGCTECGRINSKNFAIHTRTILDLVLENKPIFLRLRTFI